MKKFLKYLPILIIAVLMVVIYLTGAYKAIDFDKLRAHHRELQDLVDDFPILTPIIFMAVYAASTTLSIPGGLFLSMIGGYLFPQPMSTIYVVFGATAGATLLFLAAREAFGRGLKKKAAPWIDKMKKGFQKNAANYMLFLRLVPLFPFWVVNLAPAFFNVRLRTYVWTTFVGIIPGAFVFTQAGRGLNAIFDSEGEFSVSSVLNFQMKVALICLGLFALIPIVIKKCREKKRDRQ